MPYYKKIIDMINDDDFILELEKIRNKFNNNFDVIIRYLILILDKNYNSIYKIIKFINCNEKNKYIIKISKSLENINIIYDNNNLNTINIIINLLIEYLNIVINKNKNLSILLNEVIYYINKLKTNNQLLKYQLVIYFLRKIILLINNNNNLTKIYLDMDETMSNIIKIINKNIN